MSRRLRIALAVLLLLAVALAAAWFDVLPGGWTLRGLAGARTGEAVAAYRAHRDARLAEFARDNALAPPGAVAFLGSSTIERFPLAACFPGKPALNRGISGEPLEELAERLAASLPDAPLAGLVLYAARIDFRADPSRPEPLARRAAALLDRLAELRPGVPVCVLGLLSERGLSPDGAARLARFDAELEREVRARGQTFVRSARPPLVDGRGALAEAFSSDPLHLGSEGYTVLARWIAEEGGPAGRALAP